MTTLSLTHEDVAKLLDNLAPQLGQLEARAREFAQRIGIVSELRKQATLAAQLAAEQQAINEQARAEFIARLEEHCEWLDAIATQEAARP